MSAALKDSSSRPIRDLRVSLTDRRNSRCFYCLLHGEPPITPREPMPAAKRRKTDGLREPALQI